MRCIKSFYKVVRLGFSLAAAGHLAGCAATPLQIATLEGNTQQIDQLLKQGHDIDEFNTYPAGFPHAFPPAFIAVSKNDETTLRFLLDKGASMAYIHESGREGGTLLHQAAGEFKWYEPEMPSRSASPSIVKLLIARGADVNSKNGFVLNQNFTPLHHAAVSGDVQVAEILIKHGADLSARDSKGKTPLDYARLRDEKDPRKREMVSLLSKGANHAAAPARPVPAPLSPTVIVPEMNRPE